MWSKLMVLLVICALAQVAMAQVAMAQDPGDDGGFFPFGILIAEQTRASFSLVGAGARAAGMGGAFTAVADDATAASFNPAGLAQLIEPEASFVMSRREIRDDYLDFVSFGDVSPQLLSDAGIEHANTGFNFASFTWPFRYRDRRWAVQLSTHRLIDFDYQGSFRLTATDLDEVPLAAIRQDSVQRGDISIVSGSVALELTPRTLVGATVNRWDGDWSVVSLNQRSSLIGPGSVSSFELGQRNSMDGWNVDLGLLLRYPHFNLGVRYRTAFDADVRIAFDANPLPPGQDDLLTPLETELSWPSTLNIGLSLKLSDRWIVAADWGRTDWSALEIRGIGNFFDLFPRDETGTTPTEDIHIGTELLFFAGDAVIPIRAGWFREPQPARDLFTGERLDGEGFSVGIGYKRGAFAADLAIRRSSSSVVVTRYFLPEDTTNIDPLLRPNSIGRFEREVIQVFASVILQFPRGSTGRNLLHEIFVGPVDDAS